VRYRRFGNIDGHEHRSGGPDCVGRKIVPFLAKKEIRDRITKDALIKQDHFQEALLRQASYDLRLGPEIYIVGDQAPKLLTEEEPYATLPPGQFAILTCYEDLKMPRDLIAFISVRSKFKLEGLVNISGFHVDPTFRGRLRFAVQNVGPTDMRIKFLEPTFTIFFAQLSSENVEEARDEQKDIDYPQGSMGILLQDVQLLGGSSLSLASLQKEVDRLRTLFMIYIPIGVSAIVALIVKLLK
jgi:dCTP deaminase